MISFAFYVAYTVGSVLYFMISAVLKKDILITVNSTMQKLKTQRLKMQDQKTHFLII